MIEFLVFAAVVAFNLYAYRSCANMARKSEHLHDGIVLIKVLKSAQHEDILSEHHALAFFAMWEHHSERMKPVRCACRNVELHCIKDTVLSESGVVHTGTGCDLPEGGR